MYSLMIDAFVKDPIEKNMLFSAVENFESIKKKADWALKWAGSKCVHLSCPSSLLPFLVVVPSDNFSVPSPVAMCHLPAAATSIDGAFAPAVAPAVA